MWVKEGRDGNIKGQMKLVPSGHSDCSFYSVTCHRGSRCLLGVSHAGLLTHSTFNITDWIVQGVTIDSDTAHWKGARLHILFFAPSVSASPTFTPASSSSSSTSSSSSEADAVAFSAVSKITVKSSGEVGPVWGGGVLSLAFYVWTVSVWQQIIQPPPVNVMTRLWRTSSCIGFPLIERKQC